MYVLTTPEILIKFRCQLEFPGNQNLISGGVGPPYSLSQPKIARGLRPRDLTPSVSSAVCVLRDEQIRRTKSHMDGVTSSPKRNRAKVQKTKGSHGGARANAGRKPSTSKLHKWCAATSLPHLLHHFTSKKSSIRHHIFRARIAALSEICKGIGRFIRYSAKISRGLRPLDPPWGFGAARRTARIGASRLFD